MIRGFTGDRFLDGAPRWGDLIHEREGEML